MCDTHSVKKVEVAGVARLSRCSGESAADVQVWLWDYEGSAFLLGEDEGLCSTLRPDEDSGYE